MTPDSPLVQGIGNNIAAFRNAANLSQPDLAARINKSVQWLRGVEQGRLYADRLTDLINIANVLDCRLDDLLGRPIDALAPGVKPKVEAVGAVREAIKRTPVVTASGTAPELAEVGSRVAEAWTVWHSSPTAHRVLGGILPALITDVMAAYRGADDRRQAARTLAGAWQVTRQWLHHIPEGELAWVAAERAMSAAREAEDPHLIALGAWALSASYRRAGQQDEATRLCLSAADELKGRIDGANPDHDLLADYGMLHLAASISAAQSDEDGRAWALHRVAEDTARALGARYQAWTAFGRGNVDIHGLALQAELGRSDAVIEYSRRLNIDAVPSVERRTRALIDTARGFASRGDDEAAALVLIDAEKISADEVHHSGLVHEMLRTMVHRDRARSRSHVRGLAQRCGIFAS
ncbi:helix-turn-helix domain-containing protein [Nocardia panacis]|nr:helix-turn-helix domain-containing protein [Nocardia panacis]